MRKLDSCVEHSLHGFAAKTLARMITVRWLSRQIWLSISGLISDGFVSPALMNFIAQLRHAGTHLTNGY